MKLTHLFKHTIIYGIATVLPRLLNLVLTPLHIDNLQKSEYGIYQVVFAYMILGNVLLSYGMETAFFRFVNKETDKRNVQQTALTSLFLTSTIFFIIAWLLKSYIASWLSYPEIFVRYTIAILALDALVVIPFAWFRSEGRPLRYTVIKIGNVVLNLILNLFFFLGLPFLQKSNSEVFQWLAVENKVEYVFIANFVASLLTFLVLLGVYRRIGLGFSTELWKKMFAYAFPVLVAGIAFSINEGFDRIFIRMFYPTDTADAVVGVYGACYKMGVFMTLFITAYRLGIEPFFFSAASDRNAPETYANITRVFVIFGSFILLFVSVYTDIFKRFLIPDASYWEALWIVPFILMANLFLGIYHSLSVWYKVTDKTSYGAYISVIGGGITIVANFLLLPIMGYRGAAVATLLAYGGMMLLSYFIGQKKYPIPYELRSIGAYLLFSIAATIINFYFFKRNIWTGSAFILLYLATIFYFEKKLILSVLRKNKVI